MRYREVTQKLRKLGCYEVPSGKGGSHRRWYNPQLKQDATLPDQGRRDLRIGTLRSAIRQLGIDWQEFRNT